MTLDPIAWWHSFVREETDAKLCASLAKRMRERHLTFGGRLLCPFLRPFFLDPADEGRVKRAAETLWRLGERLAEAAATDDALMAELGLSEPEMALARIDPRYRVASTAGRADAFLLPDSLQFAEYNAESPAGPGYSQRLAELFDGEPLMARFRERFDVRFHTPISELLDALLESYQDWGGKENLPRIAIVDWREVPTWSEFELLRGAFLDAGVPTEIADPRDLVFDGRRLTANGVPVDLVYRRALINDIVAQGLTPDQLRNQLKAQFDKYVEDSSVSVVVKQINSRKVFITGMVGKPGSYPLTSTVTVLQLISMAGGLNEFARGKEIVVMRTEDGKQKAMKFNYEDVRKGRKLQQNIELRPGDTVLVP